MREGEDAVKQLAPFALLLILPGCGAIFHSSQTVDIVTRPDDNAVVYENGLPIKAARPGDYQKSVFLNMTSGGAVAVAPGKRMKRVAPGRHVDAVAVVCDVLWTLTIVGIAAPISDGLLGTFSKTESPFNVQLEPDDTSPNPMPEYSIEGATIAATATPRAASAPPPPAPPPSSSAPPPSSSSPKSSASPRR